MYSNRHKICSILHLPAHVHKHWNRCAKNGWVIAENIVATAVSDIGIRHLKNRKLIFIFSLLIMCYMVVVSAILRRYRHHTIISLVSRTQEKANEQTLGNEPWKYWPESEATLYDKCVMQSASLFACLSVCMSVCQCMCLPLAYRSVSGS